MLRLSKRCVILVLAAAVLFAASSWAGPALDDKAFCKPELRQFDGDTFEFAVMGDVRNQGTGDRIQVPDSFLANIDDVNVVAPEFTVIIGDLILGYSEDMALVEKQWDAYVAACGRFDQPAFSVIGNHDVSNKPMEDYFIGRFGDRRWFSWDFGNSHFIALDSDLVGGIDRIEGEQLDWLKADLSQHSEARHTFVLLHKPLWRPAYTASNWMKDVHPLLRQYGVTAVFAGHEHWYQKDDPIDGIAYYVTGGGGAEIGAAEYSGDFYHYMVVRVAGDDVTYSVRRDGREYPDDLVTAEQHNQMHYIAQELGTFEEPLKLDPASGFDGRASFALNNTTPYPIRYRLQWDNLPPNWKADELIQEGDLEPGSEHSVSFKLSAIPAPLTEPFVGPALKVDYTAKLKYMSGEVSGSRPVPVDFGEPPAEPETSGVNRSLQLDGKGQAIQIPFDERLNIEGPFTMEAWLKVGELGDRVGAMTRTESSGYGLFLAEGEPEIAFYLHDADKGAYVQIAADPKLIEPGRWTHVACTYDGDTASVWVNGKLAAKGTGPKTITRNKLPFYIGADTDNRGMPVSFLAGSVDEFRLSTVCRYDSEFHPPAVFEPDGDTLVLYHFDSFWANRILDFSGNGMHGVAIGGGHLTGDIPGGAKGGTG
jgi:hypothetical protein